MKRILSILLVFALLGSLAVSVSAAPAAFSVDAKAALLLDLNTGETIYEQDADEILYPASLTKVMTAILAIEKGNLSDVVTASSEALTGLDPDGTTVWLTAGEKMPLEDLLYCMLLASANDACNVVAEHIAGSVSAFVDMMNEKAAELGCTNTHFNNTNGLPDEDHWTTARDLATITQYAIQNPTFWEICTTTAYTVAATNVFDARMLVTTNSMTTTYKYYYYYDPRIQGVKTGFTSAAGRCLIVTAQDGDMRLLSVVLGAPDTTMYNNVNWYGHYADTAMLLEYGFGVLSGAIQPAEEPAEEPEAPQEAQEDPADIPEEGEASEDPAQTPAEEPETPQAPVSEPVTSGLVTLDEHGQAEPQEEPEPTETEPVAQSGSTDGETAEKKHFPWGLLILLILAVLVEACVVYILIYRRQYQANQRRVAQRKAQQAQDEERYADYEDDYDYKA